MDIQGFLCDTFIIIDGGFELSSEPTLLNDQYYMSNYVYDATHAIACYNEKDSLIDVKITVRDSNNDTHTIIEQYHTNGTKLGVYIE